MTVKHNRPLDQSFVNRCLNDTIQGLRDGLSHFSGASTAAVIFRLPGSEDLSIFDPDSLLRGHELKIRKFYYDNNNKQHPHQYNGESECYSSISPVADFELDGLLSFGGSSATVPYQMWFTEHHPDLVSTGPTEKWLEHAVLRFSHDIANEAALYTGISGTFLREYSTHAIHTHIASEMVRLAESNTRFNILPILDAILGVLRTREEGLRPSGDLVFVSPEEVEGVSFMARFMPSELPQLHHYKHVRKLLQSVAGTEHKLISDGATIQGIAYSMPPVFSLMAEYHGSYGYLRINDDYVCSFSDGQFKSSSMRAKLYEVEEALLDYDLDSGTRDSLFQIVSTLVHRAQSMKHGCAIVIDLNEQPAKIAGQMLQNPLELQNSDFLELACGFSQVDGALHICKDLKLHGFACLLDGHTIDGEDRARGARYNSALRFTTENPQTIVVVVSSDRPVSVIQQGIVLLDQCNWRSMTDCSRTPEPLRQWLSIAD